MLPINIIIYNILKVANNFIIIATKFPKI